MLRNISKPFFFYGIFMICVLFFACVEEMQVEEFTENTQNSGRGDEEPTVDLPGLPIDVAGYSKWLKLNAVPIPPAAGGEPHLGTKNVYVNQTRERLAPNGKQQFPYPEGSIVVKEAYRPDKQYVGLIAIMRKIAGTNLEHNDWEFIEYVRNAPDAEFSVIAAGGICWGCHVRVEESDYVFTVLD